MTSVVDATDAPVRRTISVKATAEQAFQVFTEAVDTGTVQLRKGT